MIERGKVESVWDAVQRVDLSRSAFYKYRDTVFPFHTIVKERLITLFFYLEDRSGTLSHLLTLVASTGCNLVTIHQTIPLQGRANVTLSINTSGMKMDIEELLTKLEVAICRKSRGARFGCVISRTCISAFFNLKFYEKEQQFFRIRHTFSVHIIIKMIKYF